MSNKSTDTRYSEGSTLVRRELELSMVWMAEWPEHAGKSITEFLKELPAGDPVHIDRQRAGFVVLVWVKKEAPPTVVAPSTPSPPYVALQEAIRAALAVVPAYPPYGPLYLRLERVGIELDKGDNDECIHELSTCMAALVEAGVSRIHANATTAQGAAKAIEGATILSTALVEFAWTPPR